MPKFTSSHWKNGIALGALGSALLLAACGGDNKKVYFANLADGASVESPFKVEMKAENLVVEPATMGVNDGHGHFHIILDAPLASPSEPMPKDGTHIHYGEGQTETILDLPVGQHALILQFAKGDHVPYDPPVYQQITINVTKQNAPPDTAGKKVDSAAAAAAAATAATAATAPGAAPVTTGSAATTRGDTAKDTASAAVSQKVKEALKGETPTKAEANEHEGHKKEKVLPKP